MFINKTFIYGNLTRDPELKALPSGSQVCSFSLATNHTYKDRDDKMQEQVEYHNIVVYGKQAESVARFMRKGSGLFVEGRIQTRSWETDGVKHYRTEIIAERTQFGPSKSTKQTEEKVDTVSPPEYPDDDINPEDIPF